MDSDNTFRYVLLAVVVMIACIGAFHRVRARTGESLNRMQEGLFFLIALRLAGLGCFIGLAAYLVKPSSLAFSAIPLPDWLRWIGVTLGAVTILLLFWTLQNLGRNFTDTVVTRKHHTLITLGPYRWVRHPFYACAALIILAICLITANAFFLVPGGLAILLFGLRTRVEERNLLRRFGDDYQKYMERTGRFFPRF